MRVHSHIQHQDLWRNIIPPPPPPRCSNVPPYPKSCPKSVSYHFPFLTHPKPPRMMNKLKNSAMRTVPSHPSMKPQVDTLKPTLDLTTFGLPTSETHRVPYYNLSNHWLTFTQTEGLWLLRTSLAVLNASSWALLRQQIPMTPSSAPGSI